jgi:DNA-binding NarL/FixJ family response regulator
VRERKTTSAFMRTSEHEPEKNLGLVWISSSPYEEEEEEMVLLVKEALEEKTRVHVGTEPPRGEDPCCVLLCPNGKDIYSQMRHLRSQAPDLPVVVFCQSKELRLVEQALRAGASGIVHAQMRPEKIALALSLASEGEVLIPRELLGELIGQRLFLRRPRLLDP